MSEPVTHPPVSGDMSADAPASAEHGQHGQAPAEVRAQAVAGPRRVRLALTRVNALSVMKVSFLLSVATGIMLVIAAALVWFMLDKMHVFSTIQDLVGTMFDSESNAFTALVEYMRFSRAISMATIIAVVNIVLSTALSTIGALLYNVTAALVGGVHLTLADE
ncbi:MULTISPECIES: DUF3566 domain-containing protein [unclassified Actinomyces]|uniref:DUF3566 domain-containing protein n=1 Tax=unclassified Actinomyces TaxID=2609248 RepID=UPI00201783D0|nr:MULTISPECIES: DUF3566 domain-containing protein [unclassified Actinomyces]MCL3778540.1 DUF3566 domain-containing protein [Actinomyces sp. AC-20-1]MCL3789493.1 DUF3566 domain-containing protein [Actinomyces sp. 187325]MCL3791822.1 DUF3566 domain-containing protein [Actinomyces sp. 186855]MCL3793501.1 DUF3566 domain-containing protein [Actinomyces sp. 217892]